MSQPEGHRVLVEDQPDWTWVLERPCPECGVDVSRFAVRDIPRMICDNADDWAEVLAGSDVSTPRKPNHWSPLEYACHIRDVFELYHDRLGLMLTEDAPHFANWDQDASAIEKDYANSDPEQVASEIRTFAELLAARFETVGDDEWTRTGRRSDGANFTIETFARYFIHDPLHHLWDVGFERG